MTKNKVTLKEILRWMLYLNLFGVFFLSFGLAGRYPYNYLNIALWLFVAILYFALRRIEHIKLLKFRFDIFFIAVAVYCLAILLSYALSGFLSFSMVGIVCALSGLLIYWMLSDGIVSKKAMLLCASAGAIAFLAVFAFVYKSDIFHPTFSKRIGDYFNNQNEIALNIALCMFLLFGLGIEQKKWYFKASGICLSLVAFYFVMLTGSVSAILTSAITFFITVPFCVKRHRLIVVIGEILTVVVATVAIFSLPAFSYFAQRISGIFSSFGLGGGRGDGSTESRFSSIIIGLRIFLENPLFGAGNDAVFRNYDITSHNNFAQVLANYGIFAFLAHESVMVLSLVKLKKADVPYKLIVLPTLLYVFLFQFFLFTFNSKPASILIPLCFYLVFPTGCYTKSLKRASIKITKIST